MDELLNWPHDPSSLGFTAYIPDTFGCFGTPFYVNQNVSLERGRGKLICTFFPPYLLSPLSPSPPPPTEERSRWVPSYAPPPEKYVNPTTKQQSCWTCMPARATQMEVTYWKPSTKDVNTLLANPPELQQNVLLWILWRTEILYLMRTDTPPWDCELDLPEPFHPPLTCQKVSKEFLIQFLKASFEIPEECYRRKQTFIMPIIPWEFSRDSFLPSPKDRDCALINEYDKAWACLHALTYSVMVTENNPRDYPEMTNEEKEEIKQSLLTGAGLPGKSPMYI